MTGDGIDHYRVRAGALKRYPTSIMLSSDVAVLTTMACRAVVIWMYHLMKIACFVPSSSTSWTALWPKNLSYNDGDVATHDLAGHQFVVLII